jgi:hypothetical protein
MKSRRSSWGWITALAGTVVALVAALWPISLTIFGSNLSCGPAVIALFASPQGEGMLVDMASQCRMQAISPVVIAFVVLAGGWVALGADYVLNERREGVELQAAHQLRAAVQRLHSPDRSNRSTCVSCKVIWPCPTAQAAGASTAPMVSRPQGYAPPLS